MDDQWPPPGHAFTYAMTVNLGHRPPFTVEITTPSSQPGGDVATLRLARIGGPNRSDMEFRDTLYRHLGAITVAAGHAEAAMKRVAIVGSETLGTFSQVDWTWSQLEVALQLIAADDSELGRGVAQVLEWASDKRIKGRRDDAIHAYWWDHEVGSSVRGRFARREDGKVIVGDLADLAKDGELIAEFANRLDSLVVSDWPQARLPEGQDI